MSYPGLKEDVYIHDFQPDPAILTELNLDPNRLILTVRPPANWAHYHDRRSELLFHALIERLRRERDAQVVIVPRTDKQRAELIARREAALLANKEGASSPKQLDASNAREIALEAESKLASGVSVEVHDAEPARLREKPPTTVVERADLQEERMRREGWRAVDSGELDD